MRKTPFQKKIYYGSSDFKSTLPKKIFLGALVNCVFLYGSNNSDSVIFGNAAFGDISKITVWERHLFNEKKNCYGSFGFVSTLRQKAFSGAPGKFVFLYGSNNSDSVIFRNAAFGDIKDHSLSRIDFLKYF